MHCWGEPERPPSNELLEKFDHCSCRRTTKLICFDLPWSACVLHCDCMATCIPACCFTKFPDCLSLHVTLLPACLIHVPSSLSRPMHARTGPQAKRGRPRSWVHVLALLKRPHPLIYKQAICYTTNGWPGDPDRTQKHKIKWQRCFTFTQ